MKIYTVYTQNIYDALGAEIDPSEEPIFEENYSDYSDAAMAFDDWRENLSREYRKQSERYGADGVQVRLCCEGNCLDEWRYTAEDYSAEQALDGLGHLSQESLEVAHSMLRRGCCIHAFIEEGNSDRWKIKGRFSPSVNSGFAYMLPSGNQVHSSLVITRPMRPTEILDELNYTGAMPLFRPSEMKELYDTKEEN